MMVDPAPWDDEERSLYSKRTPCVAGLGFEIVQNRQPANERSPDGEQGLKKSGNIGETMDSSDTGPSRKPLRPKVILISFGLFAAAMVIGTWFAREPETYAEWQSPDGNHTLTVYRTQTLFSMPGQGSDAPGMVVLRNAHGKLLNRQKIEMVQLASEPEWTGENVRMKLILDWPLE